MAESHQPPYSLQPPPRQQHQNMAPWYGMPPHLYQPQQAPAPLPQHHSMPWTAPAMPPRPPPSDPSYGYAPPHYHPPAQADFYPRLQQQVHHHYPPPSQPAQPQFTYMYGQQDQVWHQANNSWGYQQWSHPAQTASLSQEEVWAAKARAWAASKAVQDESRPNPNAAQQIHQDYKFQPQEEVATGGLPPPLQPPGQEGGSILSYQDNVINQAQSAQLRGQSEHPPQSLGYTQPVLDTNQAVKPEPTAEGLDQKALQAGQSHASDGQSMFASSPVITAPASYGLDTSSSGSQGNESLLLSKKLPTVSAYSHQTTHMLPQSQASPLMSQPNLPFTDKVSNTPYEQQQQMPSSYLQPAQPPNPQQPPSQIHHQPPKLPLQNHYPASTTLEGVDGEFGLSSGSVQNWAPVGGPGMPFPPAMGAGTSQFDPGHAPHQLPMPWRPDGTPLQGLGFPNSAPFAVGTNPGLGPGSGSSPRPLFATDSFVERPKKAAVPSWLREELLKKKAAGLSGNTAGVLSSDEISRVNGGEPSNTAGPRVRVSDKLRSSTPGLSEDDEEDQEEEIEAARSAAINLEIKRLLTEVLLKVTGDLFKEIAQEVLDEDGDDMLQDGQIRVDRPASPVSPTVDPVTPSGRVFVSSGRNPVPDDKVKEEESSDSGGPAGDVLGLGNYASDDEMHEPKTDEASFLQADTDKKSPVMSTGNSAEHNNHEGNSAGSGVDGHLLASNTLQLKGNSEGFKAGHISENLEQHAYDGGWQNVNSSMREDFSLPPSQIGNLAVKESMPLLQVRTEQSCLKEKAHLVSKEEGKCEDASTMLIPQQESSCHGLVGAISKKLDQKEISLSQDIIMKEKEDKRDDMAMDIASKERRREDKAVMDSKSRGERDDRSNTKSENSTKERRLEERTKDTKQVKRSSRGSDFRTGDSSREKKKEMDRLKEKSKSRMRESDRDRKQEKKEREGRSRRGEGVEKKARHRSTSSSNSARREGSSSSNSDRSRGRLSSKRSSRHHTSASSPAGRSRKRRASRSRSRSRSPHVKHTHRRNVPSPSHEKSRRVGSKSPVHRRSRG